MAKLTAKGRKRMSAKAFALPGKRYPINDKAHARAALSRVAANGSSTAKAKVRKYPTIKIAGTTKRKK